MIHVSIQGRPSDRTHWRDLARTADAGEFDTLYVADHVGTESAPFVALAAAAVMTERIRLGTCVINAGRWDPLTLASEIATLDVLSGGRTLLGLGAGHTPAEWSMSGLEIPRPHARVARLAAFVEAVRPLLSGKEVTTSGSDIGLKKAILRQPRPIQDPIPLMIGGNGRALLTFAATSADIVGVTGLGKTLPDGHSHEVDWRSDTLDATFEVIRATAASAGHSPQTEVLVQHVELTDDAESRAEEVAGVIPGVSAVDLLASPFVWIGKTGEIVEQLRQFEEHWGITRYVVREGALNAAAEILHALRDAT